jgi:hypothetical protein
MRQGNDIGTQYRSAIFVTDDVAAGADRGVKAMFQERLSAAGYGEITSDIEPLDLATGFFYAEPYHQQYLAKNPNGYCGVGGTGRQLPHRPRPPDPSTPETHPKCPKFGARRAERDRGSEFRWGSGLRGGGSGPAGGTDGVAVGVEWATGPAQRSRRRRQPGDQALHRCAVDIEAIAPRAA